MQYVIATPETLAATAAEAETIRGSISAASATAAGPTSGLLAAAQDEVSTAITQLFDEYGLGYQAAIGQAVAFHREFTQALAAAASAYAQAEAGNAALVSGASNALNASVQTLLGQAPMGSGGSPAASIALIMGGTGNPLPGLDYVLGINTSYIQRLFPGFSPMGLFTPEMFWPVTPQLGAPFSTFGQSVTQGVALLNAAINTANFSPGNSVVVFGYSQSATIATNEINALMAMGSPHADQLSFVLIGDPNNPNGGLLERFTGFYIPALDVLFNGATPPNSPYATTIYTAQYDGIADAPQYPLNILSDVNAFMGYFFVHGTYPMMTPDQVANAVALPTSPGYTGHTEYFMLMTQDLPLLDPIRAISYAGAPIADIFQPDLRVLVDMGYSDYGPGQSYANVPTPAGLLSIPNPFTIVPDLALGAVQGPYGAAVEIGVESGLLSPSYFPDTYPWVPSTDPGLNIFLGQPSVTGLSTLTGALGGVLEIIPPVFNLNITT
jgi:PE-PPE domain/PE family